MRKFITFEDGHTVEVAPLTYLEFSALGQWTGADDLAYAQWLRHNSFVDAQDYSTESLRTARFWIGFEPRESPILFCTTDADDSESWAEYDHSAWEKEHAALRSYALRSKRRVEDD